MTVVYLLKCPETMQVRYVGEGSIARPYAHTKLVRRGKMTANPRLTKWIAGILEKGLEPLVEIIHQDLTKLTAIDIEEQLIKQYGRSHFDAGGTLLNIAQRGMVYDKAGDKNPFFGKTHRPETILLQAAAKIGKKRGSEFSETMRKVAAKRPPQSLETRMKKRASMLARWEQKRLSACESSQLPPKQ